VDIRFKDIPKRAVADEMVQRAEVAVESPVWTPWMSVTKATHVEQKRLSLTVEHGQDLALLIRQ
jgi:hypothetical protein